MQIANKKIIKSHLPARTEDFKLIWELNVEILNNCPSHLTWPDNFALYCI